MNPIHDRSICYIKIKCGRGEIVFRTNIVNENHPEEKEMQFSGVIGFKLVNILEGNIIFDITKENPNEFFKNHASDLQEYQRDGLRLNCSNPEHFRSPLTSNSVSVFYTLLASWTYSTTEPSLFLRFYGSQVHAYLLIRYWLKCQVKYTYSCAYAF